MTGSDTGPEHAGRRHRLRRYLGLGPFPGRDARGAEAYGNARTLLVVRMDGTSVAVPDWSAYEVTRGFRLTVTRSSGTALIFERDQWATYRYEV